MKHPGEIDRSAGIQDCYNFRKTLAGLPDQLFFTVEQIIVILNAAVALLTAYKAADHQDRGICPFRCRLQQVICRIGFLFGSLIFAEDLIDHSAGDESLQFAEVKASARSGGIDLCLPDIPVVILKSGFQQEPRLLQCVFDLYRMCIPGRA